MKNYEDFFVICTVWENFFMKIAKSAKIDLKKSLKYYAIFKDFLVICTV